MRTDRLKVLFLCTGNACRCRVFPGSAVRVHRPFADPPRLAAAAASTDEALAHYRRVRDQIRAFIETLPDALDAGGST